MRKIWNWIVGEVHTVESLVANFAAHAIDTVKALEEHAVTKIEHATQFDKAIAAATVARDVAAETAAKAVSEATKIKALVG